MIALVLACHTIEKFPAEDSALELPPDVCGGEIYVPQSGYTSFPDTLGDAHAEVYGASAEPKYTHLSWAGDPAQTMAFIWQTDTTTMASQVEYGPDESYGHLATGRSFLFGAEGAERRAHEVHACDLSPGTTWHYRVGGAGGWSEDRTFTTAPAPGSSGPFRFMVAGDSRDDQETFGLLLDAAEAHAPDFYLFTGDAVDIGTNQDEWDAWFTAGEGHFDARPIMVAHGNHEFHAQHYYAQFAFPNNEQWYAFEYADALFMALNDTVVFSTDKEVQAGWMAEELAASNRRWRFAFHHMPAYTSSTVHAANTELQALWSPIEEAGGVAIDFAGHNHAYERSVPLTGGLETTSALGTTYVVAAGAGAPLYDNDLSEPYTVVAAVTENFSIVEIDGGVLTLEAYDLAGNLLDRFVMER